VHRQWRVTFTAVIDQHIGAGPSLTACRLWEFFYDLGIGLGPPRRSFFGHLQRRPRSSPEPLLRHLRHERSEDAPDRLPLSLLRAGLENLRYELEKLVFPFQGLVRAISRCDFENE